MSDQCSRIEAAVSKLDDHSKPEDTTALVKIMQELNTSHILGTTFYSEAAQTARDLDAIQQYTKVIKPGDHAGIAGAQAELQQDHGIANTLSLTEGPRTEELRLVRDNAVPTPDVDFVTYVCSGQPVRTMSNFRDGQKQTLEMIELPHMLIFVDDSGKPTQVQHAQR